MKFISKDTDPELFYRMESDDGRIEIGVYPVIFGFRVRVGYTGYGCYELDYCAGDKIQDIEALYSAVLTILTKYSGNFNVFPAQKVKPMYNDPECWVKLLELIKDVEPIQVKTPDVDSMKAEYLKKLWS